MNPVQERGGVVNVYYTIEKIMNSPAVSSQRRLREPMIGQSHSIFQ